MVYLIAVTVVNLTLNFLIKNQNMYLKKKN
jgi:hypothetical protein